MKKINDRSKNVRLVAISINVIGIILVAFGFIPLLTKPGAEISVCMHIESFNDATVADLAELGARWVRIDWIPGKMDNFTHAMQENNISVLGIIDSNTFQNKNFTMTEWNKTVKSVLHSSGADSVDAWEIWNEPNGKGQAYLAPEVYSEMLRSAYTLIKNVSSVPVVAAGLAPINDWVGYLKNVYSYNGTSSYLDCQGAHVYNDVAVNLAALSNIKGIVDKPIWITEIGMPSAPNYTETEQATYLSDNYVALASHAGKIFWYELYDESGKVPEQENHFGLITLDGARKSAFDVLREIGKK